MTRRRIPILPTVLVVAAALLMVRLGLWQLERRQEKAVLLARYAANQAKPPVAFAALWPVEAEDLFRRTAATCIQASGWRTEAGHTASGQTGWRHIAGCRTGAEGPGLLVDLGISQTAAAPAWKGGRVAGRLTWGPSGESILSHLTASAAPPTPMIVSDIAAPGLQPTQAPDPATIPNNHLAYAVQWFVFAGLALGIYAILLWRRMRPTNPPQ